ncbi:hypothetical protein I4U23_023503 [Adineta vaga]|nr:hypothetical protein I4U23_023503 [Adineta vaga]
MKPFLLFILIALCFVISNLSHAVHFEKSDSNVCNLKVKFLLSHKNPEQWIQSTTNFKWKLIITGLSKIAETKVHQKIRQAFNDWSIYPGIIFHEVSENDEVDFNLIFAANYHQYDISSNDFDTILMHTMSSSYANILFETNKDWIDPDHDMNCNLYLIMKHQIGYILGLEHPDDKPLNPISDETLDEEPEMMAIAARKPIRFSRAIVNNGEITTTNASDELPKSRMENGRYSNSFNSEFKFPSAAVILRWKFTTRRNTKLPNTKQELDRLLPVIRHSKSEELYQTKFGIRFIWIGHASSYVQMNNFRFLLDPVFSERCGINSMIGPKRYRPTPLTVNDLPDNLDAIFISHNHFDHLDYASVKELNKRYGKQLTWFCGRGLRQWFLGNHVKNVIELDWWENYHYSKKNISIAFLPAQHWSRRGIFDLNKSLWGGFAIWDSTHKFYFAGDTGYTHNISIFRQIGERYGPFDLSAIPIGAYEPRWMMEAQHVSPDEAVQIHIDVQSNRSIGIHWGTWALANEYFMEPPTKLSEAVKHKQLDPSSFIVVKHGEIFDLP